ncbi:MAG TPA: serine/threonine-protein kinase, partial [Polyangiaceae bacterium]|nr:serine/threonine-protein kinase [Polyangiaceae bacterium]
MDSEEELAAQRIGQVVGGRWTLERVLGVGGMAAVYAARGPFEEVAALKLLHPDMAVRRDVRERFLREGYVANSIDHPGVVRALEHGDGSSEVYLAMELLLGETLAMRVKRHGKLPLGELLDYCEQILEVLAIAHDKGIVHRDLKPDNLFVTNDDRIKILDFGLARLRDGVPTEQMTRTGLAVGTLPYMPPEQALGRRAEIDGRVDLFALGATMFRILAGRRVHEADSEAELLMAMASKPAVPLKSVMPDVPDGVCAVVDLALAFSRDARYPDARTMLSDVQAVRRGEAPPFASARFSAREEATRTDRMVPSQRQHVTVPLAAYQPAAPAPIHERTQPLGPPSSQTYVENFAGPPSTTAPMSSPAPLSAAAPPSYAAPPSANVPPSYGPPQPAVASQSPPTRKRGGLWIGVAVVGVLLLGAGGAAAWM